MKKSFTALLFILALSFAHAADVVKWEYATFGRYNDVSGYPNVVIEYYWAGPDGVSISATVQAGKTNAAFYEKLAKAGVIEATESASGNRDILNSVGAAGWELVQIDRVHDRSAAVTYTLKRPKK